MSCLLLLEDGGYLLLEDGSRFLLEQCDEVAAALDVIATISNDEPILDENGLPILDENGQEIWDENAADAFSPHPVNCVMAGNGPTIKNEYRTVEWMHGKASSKVTARTGGARRLSKQAPSFTSVTRKGSYLD